MKGNRYGKIFLEYKDGTEEELHIEIIDRGENESPNLFIIPSRKSRIKGYRAFFGYDNQQEISQGIKKLFESHREVSRTNLEFKSLLDDLTGKQ